MNHERDIFRPYLTRKFAQSNAVTYGEKLAVIERLIADVKQGVIPVSSDQVVRLNSDSPPVLALRNGQSISLDGRVLASGTALEVSARKKRRNLLLALLLLSVLPMLGFAWWVAGRTSVAEGQPVALEAGLISAEILTSTLPATALPTIVPTALPQPVIITQSPSVSPTFTPVPIELESYEVTVSDKQPLAINQNPIALSFTGRDFRVHPASLAAVWQPSGVEWWPNTHVRKVFAVPFEQALLENSFAQIDSPLHVRLRTGQIITYRLDNVQRISKLAVEHMLSTEPSVAIVLYDEPNGNNARWLITGIAEQFGAPNLNPLQPTVDRLEDVTVNDCQQDGPSITCSITASDQLPLSQLQLTDSSWLDTLSNVPPTDIISSTTVMSQTVTAWLTGVVRPSGQPVLAMITEKGISAHLIPSSVFATEDTPYGEFE